MLQIPKCGDRGGMGGRRNHGAGATLGPHTSAMWIKRVAVRAISVMGKEQT